MTVINSLKISIDGGAATGKSTVAYKVAKELNLTFINSGLLYRLVALIAKDNNLSNQPKKLVEKLSNYTFDYNGEKILSSYDFDYKRLRSTEISSEASKTSSYEEVRIFVTNILQSIATSNTGILMEGRDIGSVVMPNADFKFYLTVSIEEAVNRRKESFLSKNPNKTIEEFKQELKDRNERDRNREFAPLVQPEGSIIIDTDTLTQKQVCRKIINYVQQS